MTTIGNVCAFTNGKAHEQNVVEYGEYIIVNSKFISSDGVVKKYSNKQICPLFKNDIVMVMSDVPNGKAMSKCFCIDKDNKYTLNQRICALRTKQIPLYYMMQINRNDYFMKFDDGVKQTNLRKDDVLACPVYSTTIKEQTKIADFLSLIDQRIEKQRRLVESLKKYKRGLLSAIFDRKLRFKDENGNDYPEWDNFVLDNLGSFYNGLSGKNKDDFGTGNSEYITYMNVFKNTIANETICERVNILPNEHQNIVNFGDLLFTQSSETMEEVGFCSVWNSHKKVFLNSFCFGLHFNNSKFAYPQFMAHYMRSYKIRLLIMRESQGATRINLSSERLKKIELSLPPYKEQKIIAHFIERYDNTIQNEEKKLEMFNNLKQGLLQQMFI